VLLLFSVLRHSLLDINPLNVELNPIFHLLALLGGHHILQVIRISVKLEFKLLAKQLMRDFQSH